MLDHEDLKWIATTSTELNSMLQQVSRYADLARQHKGEYNYIDVLGDRVEMATKSAQALFDRVTSSILSNSIPPAPPRKQGVEARTPAPFTVVPPPAPSVAAVTELVAQLSAAKNPAPALEPLPKPAAEIPILNPNGKRELILLVDDEAEVIDIASRLLMHEDYRVILAADGFEALDIYRQLGSQIGLVILDFFLPVMDGDAVFDELRELNPAINVVLSSGFAEQSKVAAMLALGLRGFIPKPYSAEKLLGQVRSTLDAARGPAR